MYTLRGVAGRVYRLSDFDFDLPEELVAQRPAEVRTASRLLHVATDRLEDLQFGDLPQLLDAGDLLVLNDTRVIRSRIAGRKASGGRVELLLERIIAPDEAWMQLRASRPPRVGAKIQLEGGAAAMVLDREDRFFRLRFDAPLPVADYLERFGEVPLPPYIRRAADAADVERYQTVYAREPGAVAAPTAGLHFDAPLLARLHEKGVAIAHLTLHVGAGTFQPVEIEHLAHHRMHRERFAIPDAAAKAIDAARLRRRNVVAVGTTTLRALESAAGDDGRMAATNGETALFITPGYRFRVVDRLVTNFHLPRSTLLMLVSAFAGYETIRAAYAHAIRQRYRFFSYGDAMLLEKQSATQSR